MLKLLFLAAMGISAATAVTAGRISLSRSKKTKDSQSVTTKAVLPENEEVSYDEPTTKAYGMDYMYI